MPPKKVAYYAANKDKIAARNAAYKAANRGKIAARNAAYHAANKDKVAASLASSQRRRKYGLDAAAWAAKFEAQGRKCSCCGGDDPGSKLGWATDHDHETGLVRGILCQGCNCGIGRLKDSPKNLALALRYLASHGKALSTEELSDLLKPQEAPPTTT